MTINLDKTDLYFGIIIVLLLLQVYHHYRMTVLRKEITNIWIQISTIVTTVSAKLIALEKDIEVIVGKEKKNS